MGTDGEEATEEARKGQKGEKAQNGAREQEGGVEEQQGLRCGEANPNQGLRGISGQRPNTDSQRQPYRSPTTHRGG